MVQKHITLLLPHVNLNVPDPASPKPPRVGLEPTTYNQQGTENKALTENSNPVLATSLDKTLQKYPDLAQLVKVWPELPEHTKAAIKALIPTHSKEAK
jgi:hypothetical protein